MVLSGGNIIMSSLVAGWIAERIGERRTVILGMVLGSIGFAAIGLAPSPAPFWAGLVVIAISGMAFPSLLSLLSKRVGVDQQGQLQGALAILFGISQLIGPILFTNVFAWSIGAGRSLGAPGLTMLMGAGLIAVGIGLALAYARPGDPAVEGSPDASPETPPDPLASHAG
jgi:DHA1 family tetracycline resistance protein-like MFS transporter